MNTRKIKIPKGWIVDKIVDDGIILKEKNYLYYNTWEKCFIKANVSEMCYIDNYSRIVGGQWIDAEKDCYNVFPKEYGEAMLALMKLLTCYKVWINDWKADFTDDTWKYCINLLDNRYVNTRTKYEHHLFAFPNEKIRDNFFDIFKELFIIAKPLL